MYGIADTGPTKNYTKVDTSCVNKFKTHQGPRVILQCESLIRTTHKAYLNISPLLSTRSKTAHISPHLQSGAIISIDKLCDDFCTAIFTDTHMILDKKGEVVLEGNCKGVDCMLVL